MPRNYNPDYEHMIANADKGPFSMTFNGTVLDSVITNLVIEDVEGRDSLSSEVSELSYGRVDGSRFRYRRNESKDLTVHYASVSNTDADQRDTLNTLRGILLGPGTENAQIIFADEPDKYYVGTVSNVTQEKIIYNNTSKGTIVIRLSKPYKYAVNATTVSPQDVSGNTRFIIDYDGTRKAYPEFTITFPTVNVPAGTDIGNDGDCGFVSFVNQNGNVIQIGDPDETDLDSKSTNTTLINQKFTLWDSTASSNWSANSEKAIFRSDIVKSGSFARRNTYNQSFLAGNSFGTGEKWHGPAITYTLPANDVSDFTLSFGLIACTGGSPESAKDIITELGRLYVQVANDTGSIVDFEAIKANKASLTGTVNFYCRGDSAVSYSKNVTFKTMNNMFGFKDPNNASSAEPVRKVIIEKKSNTYKISIGSDVKSYTVNTGTMGEAKYVTIWVGAYGTSDALGSLGLTDIKFQSNHWATNQQMKNTFTTNDVCRVVCETGEIFLNNASTPSLGAVGNQWEQFCLNPGLNQIDVKWSSWVTAANKPTFTMTYRKVYL